MKMIEVPSAGLITIALSGGGPRVRIDDEPEFVPRGRRAAALVTYLALTPGHAATRDRLAELLWGQRGPDQARASLRQCLLDLRGLGGAGRWLAADRLRVLLSASRIVVDVIDAIDTIAQSQDAVVAVAALRSMHAHELLVELNAGPDVDQWALETRAMLERDLLDAASDRITRFGASASHRDAQLLAEAYLRLFPDNEEITVRAMTADIALGEGATAAKRFEELRRVLARDLGCAPGAAATRLRDDAVAGRATREPADTGVEAASTSSDGPPLIFVPAIEARPADAAYALALREEILAGFARFRDLRLSSRADPVRRGDLSARDAERAYALAITLYGNEGGSRLVARVTRVGSDEIIWVETFDLGELGSAGGVAIVVRRVIATILPAVTESLFRYLDGRASGPYDVYLLARHRSIQCRRYEEIAAAAAELERIIVERPDFAPAYAPLARLLNTDFFYSALGKSGPVERRRALDLARNAVTLDAQDAHNHAVLAFCHLWHGQPSLALTRFHRTLELNPYNPVRLQEVATGLVYIGRFAEARDILERTKTLGLGYSDAYHEDMARLLIAQADYEGALEELDLVTEPNIQTELYAAIAATLTGRVGAPAEIMAWRRNVLSRWHTGETPGNESIAAWVAMHHPFEPKLKAGFMAAVHTVLRQPAAG